MEGKLLLAIAAIVRKIWFLSLMFVLFMTPSMTILALTSFKQIFRQPCHYHNRRAQDLDLECMRFFWAEIFMTGLVVNSYNQIFNFGNIPLNVAGIEIGIGFSTQH